MSPRPTPSTSDEKSVGPKEREVIEQYHNGESIPGTHQRLRNLVAAWPTPRHEGFDAGGHRGATDSLHSAVKSFPTLDTMNHRDGKAIRKAANIEDGGRHGVSLHHEIEYRAPTGQKLHGRWTLALMGFDPDWCDDLPADPLGTTPT